MDNKYLFLNECVEKFGVSSAAEALRVALKAEIEIMAFFDAEAEIVGYGEAPDGSGLEIELGKVKLEGVYTLPDGLLGALVFGGKDKVQLSGFSIEGKSASDVVI